MGILISNSVCFFPREHQFRGSRGKKQTLISNGIQGASNLILHLEKIGYQGKPIGSYYIIHCIYLLQFVSSFCMI